MKQATKPLIDSLREWLQASDAGDYQRAMRIAEHLSDDAEILKRRPEFARAAAAYCNGMDAETAAHTAAWMLMCVSELLMRSPDPPAPKPGPNPALRPLQPQTGHLRKDGRL